ncbi:MAG: hypothetical protein D5R99_00785 [Methanocalculus sp. MSAO_Arc1]|uniref:hypothetical protein n=1 Tax=Methanocalculus TaxID=71151 RepID=UPI000FEE182C|nr:MULTISPECIES: hypothetical protein [unclassified Methanocalculus]MCP1661889.1 hypothetical protein [Methanocalculus sp. AMF5]RQD81873.1 MAG: hypothetical protein D5R99_00785 [Methanocalculus sp. MSAO_Arc1]
MNTLDLHCPQCGEPTLHVEQPSDNEIWIKCGTCNLFIGISEEEWHQIRHSENIEGRIRSLYEKDHPGVRSGSLCRVCYNLYEERCRFGICSPCVFKMLTILVILMVVASFTIWFGVF